MELSDMINLADSGAVCECGSKRLAPIGDLELGTLVICGACAAAARVTLALTPVRWSTVEAELADQPYELQAFEWTRQGVPPERRRTLAEIAATGGRFNAAERSGVVLFVVLAVAFALVLLKAVHS